MLSAAFCILINGANPYVCVLALEKPLLRRGDERVHYAHMQCARLSYGPVAIYCHVYALVAAAGFFFYFGILDSAELLISVACGNYFENICDQQFCHTYIITS